MDNPSSSSSRASSNSRRPPPQNTKSTTPPKHVQFRRDSLPRPSMNRSRPNTDELRESKLSLDYPRRASKSMDLLKREDGFMNEQSPLLVPRRSEDVGYLPPLSNVLSPDENEDWNEEEDAMRDTKSTGYLFLLTLAIGGLQIAWSVELSNGSPYLLGLGISKSLLAIVWIAGPLSGTIVQPYVGIKSDNSRSKYGKRRPFMVGGAAATIVSLMALAWTRELVGGILHGIFGVASEAESIKICSIVFAILMIYVLDFSINVIQAGIRAFIVDNAPPHQQDSANAWASRMSGVGNIVGYLFGYVNLPKYFWFFGDTQFKVLCVVASLAMASTLAISCVFISERDPRLEGEPAAQEAGVLAFFKNLFRSIRRLPLQISRVCQVQFVAWIAWFPFLFYITTYIGEIYTEPFFEDNPHLSQAETDALWEQGTRLGTRALLVYAITTFAASVILPFLVASSYQAPEPEPRTAMTPGARTPATPLTPTHRRATTPLTPHTPGGMGTSSGGGGSYFSLLPHDDIPPARAEKRSSPRNLLLRLLRLPRSLEIRWLTLRRAWMLSHFLFALLMLCTFFVRSVTAATVLVGLIGVPWAMTNWAPFALIAEEISKRDAIRRGTLRPPPTRDGEMLAQQGEEEGREGSGADDQAGVVLGIHNVAIAAPQVIATLVSSVIFKILQKERGVPGDDSVAWVLRFGGCAALVAGWLTRRVGEGG
ncbi:hypothetical protein LTR03_016914 [Friedmanniomyces endolithicus]|nr:hypothetical protein LTR03_016914 [Friedmanniomyces endolithicus]